MTPRRKKTEIEEEELGMEEVELGSEPIGGEDPSGADRPDRKAGSGERRVALFAIGALVLLLSSGALAVAITQDYYTVDLREGPQPDDEDTSDRIVLHLGLSGYERREYDDGVGDATTDDRDWTDAPIIGTLMKPLAWTGYVGLGFLVLALLAGVLHRLGALNLPGPAPVMGVAAVVLLLAGLIPFMMDIAHHIRVEWIPGRLDPHHLMFYTLEADGDIVHDVVMLPALGFYLHAGAAIGGAAGTVLLFWNEFRRAAESIRSFAEASAETME